MKLEPGGVAIDPSTIGAVRFPLHDGEVILAVNPQAPGTMPNPYIQRAVTCIEFWVSCEPHPSVSSPSAPMPLLELECALDGPSSGSRLSIGLSSSAQELSIYSMVGTVPLEGVVAHDFGNSNFHYVELRGQPSGNASDSAGYSISTRINGQEWREVTGVSWDLGRVSEFRFGRSKHGDTLFSGFLTLPRIWTGNRPELLRDPNDRAFTSFLCPPPPGGSVMMDVDGMGRATGIHRGWEYVYGMPQNLTGIKINNGGETPGERVMFADEGSSWTSLVVDYAKQPLSFDVTPTNLGVVKSIDLWFLVGTATTSDAHRRTIAGKPAGCLVSMAHAGYEFSLWVSDDCSGVHLAFRDVVKSVIVPLDSERFHYLALLLDATGPAMVLNGYDPTPLGPIDGASNFIFDKMSIAADSTGASRFPGKIMGPRLFVGGPHYEKWRIRQQEFPSALERAFFLNAEDRPRDAAEPVSIAYLIQGDRTEQPDRTRELSSAAHPWSLVLAPSQNPAGLLPPQGFCADAYRVGVYSLLSPGEAYSTDSEVLVSGSSTFPFGTVEVVEFWLSNVRDTGSPMTLFEICDADAVSSVSLRVSRGLAGLTLVIKRIGSPKSTEIKYDLSAPSTSHHIALCQLESAVMLLINGKEVGTVPLPPGLVDFDMESIFVGSDRMGANRLNGSINGPRFWNGLWRDRAVDAVKLGLIAKLDYERSESGPGRLNSMWRDHKSLAGQLLGYVGNQKVFFLADRNAWSKPGGGFEHHTAPVGQLSPFLGHWIAEETEGEIPNQMDIKGVPDSEHCVYQRGFYATLAYHAQRLHLICNGVDFELTRAEGEDSLEYTVAAPSEFASCRIKLEAVESAGRTQRRLTVMAPGQQAKLPLLTGTYRQPFVASRVAPSTYDAKFTEFPDNVNLSMMGVNLLKADPIEPLSNGGVQCALFTFDVSTNTGWYRLPGQKAMPTGWKYRSFPHSESSERGTFLTSKNDQSEALSSALAVESKSSAGSATKVEAKAEIPVFGGLGVEGGYNHSVQIGVSSGTNEATDNRWRDVTSDGTVLIHTSETSTEWDIVLDPANVQLFSESSDTRVNGFLIDIADMMAGQLSPEKIFTKYGTHFPFAIRYGYTQTVIHRVTERVVSQMLGAGMKSTLTKGSSRQSETGGSGGISVGGFGAKANYTVNSTSEDFNSSEDAKETAQEVENSLKSVCEDKGTWGSPSHLVPVYKHLLPITEVLAPPFVEDFEVLTKGRAMLEAGLERYLRPKPSYDPRSYYKIVVSLQVEDSWIPRYFSEPGAPALSQYNIFRVYIAVGSASFVMPSLSAPALGLPITLDRDVHDGTIVRQAHTAVLYSSRDEVVASLKFRFECTSDPRFVERTYPIDGFSFAAGRKTPYGATYKESGFSLAVTVTNEIDLAEYFKEG